MTLDEAWAKRIELYNKGTETGKRAIEMQKDYFHAPSNSKTETWFAAISAFYDAELTKAESNRLYYESDRVWHDAVIAIKGNVRMDWVSLGKRGWKCALETGEVFEP